MQHTLSRQSAKMMARAVVHKLWSLGISMWIPISKTDDSHWASRCCDHLSITQCSFLFPGTQAGSKSHQQGLGSQETWILMQVTEPLRINPSFGIILYKFWTNKPTWVAVMMKWERAKNYALWTLKLSVDKLVTRKGESSYSPVGFPWLLGQESSCWLVTLWPFLAQVLRDICFPLTFHETLTTW